jgi:hypothetical protein
MSISKFTAVRKILLSLFVLLSFTQNTYAGFISLDSTYGQNSITLDTDTGLEWIDPWLPIVQGRASPGFNTYYEVLAELGGGGYFDGFRFATKQDLDTLFFNSAGFGSTTALNSSTVTESDKIAAAGLISFFDTTLGIDYAPGYFWSVLDGIYDSGIANQPGGLYIESGVWDNSLFGGVINYYDPPFLDSNDTPYGFWLVRDSATAVPEPPTLILFGAYFLFWMTRRSQKNIGRSA